ncbi:MAG: hypothetical protein JKY65_07425 [Planctomycetes bacterium]|nr:hypothetical protein [Planctomycetota bacterium]
MLVLSALAISAGCQSHPAPIATDEEITATAVQLYVTQIGQDTPDLFLDGVAAELRERFVLNGYDSTGVVTQPFSEGELLEHLSGLNERVPGTAALHLTFLEAPVGLGKLYAEVHATIYDPSGRVLLRGDLKPPPRSLPEVIFPLRRPGAAGRRWCREVWEDTLSLVLAPRG